MTVILAPFIDPSDDRFNSDHPGKSIDGKVFDQFWHFYISLLGLAPGTLGFASKVYRQISSSLESYFENLSSGVCHQNIQNL